MIIVMSNLVCDFVYGYYVYSNSYNFSVALGIGCIAGTFFVLQAKALRLYNFAHIMNPGRYFSNIVLAWFSSILLVISVLFLLRLGQIFSRGAISGFALSTLLLLCFSRIFMARLVYYLTERSIISGSHIVVVGEVTELAQLSASELQMQFGLKEIARCSISSDASLEALSRRDLAELARAVAVARERGAEGLAIAIDWRRTTLISRIEEHLRISPLPVRLLPDQVARWILSRENSSVLDMLPSIELQRAPLGRAERLAKRATDLLVAIVALIMIAPLMILTALAVKLESTGPIIFRQRRTGFDGRVFSIYKFRTMLVLEDGPQITQSRRGDPRVTRVGRFLRQSSIDELPQFFNVLKGDMSIVGPRPHAIAHDDHYRAVISSYAFRHHVKPGITGWAQVNGQRGETRRIEDMEKRVELDLWYVNNWSILLDLRIMLRTCFEIARLSAY